MPSAARRRIIAALHVLAAVLCVAPALAQAPQEAPVRIARPQLVIPGRVEAPVTLQSVSIRAEVHGRFALTEAELTFRNRLTYQGGRMALDYGAASRGLMGAARCYYNHISMPLTLAISSCSRLTSAIRRIT